MAGETTLDVTFADVSLLTVTSDPPTVTTRGDSSTPYGGVDTSNVQTDLGGVDYSFVALAATSDGTIGIIFNDFDWDDGGFYDPFMRYESYWAYGGDYAGVWSDNPVTWVRCFARTPKGHTYINSLFLASDSEIQNAWTIREMYENSTSSIWAADAPGPVLKVFEAGYPPLSFDWTRPITNNSLTGSSIIDPANITWVTEPKFVGPSTLLIVDPPVNQLHEFRVEFSGSTGTQTMLIHWEDPANPASWSSNALYGYVPSGTVTNEAWGNEESWSEGNGVLSGRDYRDTSSGYPLKAPLLGGTPSWYYRPFALELRYSTGERSYWSFSGGPVPPESLSSDPDADSADPNGGVIDGPAPDSDSDSPSGGGHTIEIPESPGLPVIRDPDGTPITEDDGAEYYPLPAGLAPDSPIRLIVVGRMLQAFAGGYRIASYVIPQTVWDGLTESQQQYIGYRTRSTNNPAVTPAGATITLGSTAATFTVGSYRSSIGQGERLWEAMTDDVSPMILMNSGVPTFTTYVTPEEIAAADKVLYGGRSNTSSLTYTEALACATSWGKAGIVLPVVS